MSPTSIPAAAPSSPPSPPDPGRQRWAVTAAICVAFAVLLSLILYMLAWQKLRRARHPPASPSPASPYRAHHQETGDVTLQLTSRTTYKIPKSPKLVKVASNRIGATTDVADARTCPVCLDDFAAGTVVGRLPCGHVFCSACIELWLSKHGYTCPMWCVARLAVQITP
ncbi:Putative Zinc finger, RING-type [Colletotrichum destructivum]|uniref:Zinc finger, RING-type n=1 Tax=Colletotrichum destructivum TaxID=34406 RepID=A0AAX4IJX3_9PEZI|nr:Putative Zinc finger, RING-type [Colletotrichum destructivum]